MRLRSRNEAKPKPAAMPSEAAAMNIEDSVPNPSPPPVMTLASFTDQRLMKAANPQKNATPNEARRKRRVPPQIGEVREVADGESWR